jgi:hypothetical protein
MARGRVYRPDPRAGVRLGRLVVLHHLEERQDGAVMVMCRCDCGVERPFRRHMLLSGRRKSCGCGRGSGPPCKWRKAHLTGYRAWRSMRSRCEAPNDKDWKYYGGRGIAVCERWRSFDAFFEDMGPRPPGMTLERVDNDKGYEPGNCKWATRDEQMTNRSNTVRVAHGGRAVTASEIVRETGLQRNTVLYRIKKGWAYEDICSPPRARERQKERT